MNILFYGKDHPELNSAYSKITREILPRIMAKSDHKFSLCCSVGMEQRISEWKGLKIYPGIGDKTTCEDVLPIWLDDCKKRFPNTQSLLWIWMDYWCYDQIFNNPIIERTLWYPPFDYYPFGERISNLSKCLGVIGMCNWSKEVLQKECGLNNVLGWIGHGVNDKIYKPFGSSKAEIIKNYKETRTSLGANEEDFLVSLIFNNQTRKNISQIFEGLSIFRQQNTNIKLRIYCHSQHSVNNSYDLVALAKFYHIDDILNVPVPVNYFCSKYTEEDIAKIYNVSNLTIGGLCVHPDTDVMCKDKCKKIKDIKKGDEVITHKGEFKKVTETFVRKYDGDLIEITPQYSNIDLQLTPEHPVYVIRASHCGRIGRKDRNKICRPNCGDLKQGINKKYLRKNKSVKESIKGCNYKYFENYKPEWIKASELKKTDYLIIPRIKHSKEVAIKISDYVKNIIITRGYCYPEGKDKFGNIFKHPMGKHIFKNEVKLDSELLRLFGYYIAEGCSSSKKGSIRFCIATYENELTKDILALMKNKFNLEGKIYDNTRHRRIIEFNSSILSKLFISLFGHGARNKKIPSCFLELKDKNIKQLLKGMFLGDGNKSEYGCAYTTTSKQLSKQITLLLTKIGIIPSIYYDKTRDSYQLRLSELQMRKYDFGFKIKNISKNASRFWLDEDNIYIPIKNIKKTKYSGKVYNLEVEDHHSYMLTHLTVHNCAEGWGMVNSESMACCTPTLGLDSMVTSEIMQPVLPELLIPVKTWYTFPPANLRKGMPDPFDIAKAIRYVYDKGDEFWFDRLYKAELWKKWSWDLVADQWIKALNICEDMLNQKCLETPKPNISKEVKIYE